MAKRVIIYFNREVEDKFDVISDEGVEVEIIDWSAIEVKDVWQDGVWSKKRIDKFADWGKGLVEDGVIEQLRELASGDTEEEE